MFYTFDIQFEGVDWTKLTYLPKFRRLFTIRILKLDPYPD